MNCMLKAFAAKMEIDPAVLVTILRHDGSKADWPGGEGKSFLVEDFVYAGLILGLAVVRVRDTIEYRAKAEYKPRVRHFSLSGIHIGSGHAWLDGEKGRDVVDEHCYICCYDSVLFGVWKHVEKLIVSGHMDLAIARAASGSTNFRPDWAKACKEVLDVLSEELPV